MLLQPFSNKSVTARENSPIPMLLFRKVVRAVVSHSPLQFSTQHFAKNCRHISMRDNFSHPNFPSACSISHVVSISSLIFLMPLSEIKDAKSVFPLFF